MMQIRLEAMNDDLFLITVRDGDGGVKDVAFVAMSVRLRGLLGFLWLALTSVRLLLCYLLLSLARLIANFMRYFTPIVTYGWLATFGLEPMGLLTRHDTLWQDC